MLRASLEKKMIGDVLLNLSALASQFFTLCLGDFCLVFESEYDDEICRTKKSFKIRSFFSLTIGFFAIIIVVQTNLDLSHGGIRRKGIG